MKHSKIIHVSDCHIIPNGGLLFESNPTSRLRSCIADINTNHSDADLCIFSGDIAHNGDIESYRVFSECVSHLTIPFRVMVGNHDNRENLISVVNAAKADEFGFVQSSVDLPIGRILLLDTIKPGAHEGFFCEARRKWLEDQLKEAGELPVFICLHHPPFTLEVPHIDRYTMDAADAKAMSDIFRRATNIKYMFFGHVHRNVSGIWNNLHFHAVRGTNHQSWLDFKSSNSICSLEPPSYAILLISSESTIVHFHDFLDIGPKFVYLPDEPEGEQIKRLESVSA